MRVEQVFGTAPADFEPSRQATAVIPGSHLWSPDRAPKVEECTHAEMERGSALFTLGCEYSTNLLRSRHSLVTDPGHAATYHGAGENKCEPNDPDALRTLFAVFG